MITRRCPLLPGGCNAQSDLFRTRAATCRLAVTSSAFTPCAKELLVLLDLSCIPSTIDLYILEIRTRRDGRWARGTIAAMSTSGEHNVND
jgi:hypothetical protein